MLSLSQYADDELLPLHYLNDLLFCERRFALHSLEQIWCDNRYTTEGMYAHRKVDETASLKRGDTRRVTGMQLASYRLGLVGKADLVEFRKGDTSASSVQPYPVDFKRGKKRGWDNDDVQLCAQAMSLEEMLSQSVPCGAIFHIRSKQRREVVFDTSLRQLTTDTAARLHEIFRTQVTPQAVWKSRCKGCSLLETCMPRVWGGEKTATTYLAELLSGRLNEQA
ncbi:MAG: CRISPR-associated protein Cas4 [Planctomycetia bacterium]